MLAVRSIEDTEEYYHLLEETFRNTSEQSSPKLAGDDRVDLIEASKHDRYRGNLIISIVRRMREQFSSEHERFVVERSRQDDESFSACNNILALACRTPPLPLVIGYGNIPSAEALAKYFVSLFPTNPLSGVIGPKHLTEAFCSVYLPLTKLSVTSEMKQSLHVLLDYSPPKRVPLGHWRAADQSHVELLISWTIQFAIDAKLTSHEQTYDYAEGLVNARLAEGSIYLWLSPANRSQESVDPSHTSSLSERPVSMAFVSTCSDDMVRIGMVFTPASDRNQGYASILVNLLSKWWKDQGKTCLLYTDSENPVSNSIYYQIGYRVVSDERVIRFTEVTNTKE